MSKRCLLTPLSPEFDPARSSVARRVLEDLGAAPNRLLGQNFLVNPAALDRIVEAAGVTAGDAVLEIGPGLGALTLRLMARAGSVTAIEKDFKLAAWMQGQFGGEATAGGDSEHSGGRLHLVTGDALEVGWDELRLPADGVKVVANLPYSISKPLLRRLLEEWRPHLQSVTVLVQREVANRLIAAPGTADYGPMSLMAQLYGRTRKVFEIAPGSFFPPPTVTSTVVHIEMLPGPSLLLGDERAFWRTVRAAFGQRRKTLSNTLKPLAPRESLHRAFASAEIDAGRRGETLSLAEFARLSEALIENTRTIEAQTDGTETKAA